MPTTPRRPARRALASALVAALVLSTPSLAACAQDPGPKVAPPRDTAAATPTYDPTLAEYYEQTPEWKPCRDEYECADVHVPLYWAKPAGDQISLSLLRAKATDSSKRIGSLLVNPGGPGASGKSFVSDGGITRLSKTVTADFDIVGFDPRGVGDSAAVECIGDKELDAYRAFSFARNPKGIGAAQKEQASFADNCEKVSGDLLAYVDTVSAAKDMDVLRAVLGDEKLNYLGFSYGTFLGATYADLFPQNVGRMVLDGAIDPTLSDTEMLRDQATGFEAALRAFVADCLAGPDCALTGTVADGVEQVRRVLAQTAKTPLQTSDPTRRLTQALALDGILAPLYDDDYWYLLNEGLAGAIRDNNGDQLMWLADINADRNTDGHYTSNQVEANIAINCVDFPDRPTLKDMAAEAPKLAEASPTFGPYLSYSGLSCLSWPDEPTGERHELTADGAAPILVVGTTGDPATPYPWAEALASQLSSGVLLTYKGEGHTAYGRSNTCVTDAVDGYLVDGTSPAEGTVC